MNIEKIYNRMVSGILYIKYRDEFLYVKYPTIKTKQMADHHYDEVLKDHRFIGLYNRDSVINTAIKHGILDPDYEKNIKKISEIIDELKISLFKTGPRISEAKKIRKQLKLSKKSLDTMNSKLYDVSQFSVEGIAERARRHYVFTNSVFNKNNDRIFSESVDAILLNHVTYKYYTSAISESDIRKFARTNQWRSLWGSGKYSVFLNRTSELCDEQKSVVQNSELYDFAYKHPKCPDDDIFLDDDMFDGWYLLQAKNEEDNVDDKVIGNKDPKYQEVFVMAGDQEEADSIYGYNSSRSKQILRDRARLIKDRGEVRDHEFADVQQELMIQSNQQFNERVRNS